MQEWKTTPSEHSEQTVWIVRHGERIDSADPEWRKKSQRPWDPHLSPNGVIQARKLAKRLRGEGIAHIFASPFLRTVETAFYAAEILDLPIKIERGVCEWLSPGFYSSAPDLIPLQEIHSLFPRIDTSYVSLVNPAYPETEEEVALRTSKVIRLLVKNFPDNILVIGHAISVIGAAQSLVEGAPVINGSLCGLVKITLRDCIWTLELNGDTSYLVEYNAEV